MLWQGEMSKGVQLEVQAVQEYDGAKAALTRDEDELILVKWYMPFWMGKTQSKFGGNTAVFLSGKWRKKPGSAFPIYCNWKPINAKVPSFFLPYSATHRNSGLCLWSKLLIY
jgi:hypothetical protein